MRRLFLALLLLPAVAFAAAPVVPPQDEADPAVSALVDMEGRFTIGPWEGSKQGDLCVLANSEPLSFADFELSAPARQSNLTLRITPYASFKAEADGIPLQVDSNPMQTLLYRADEGGYAVALPQDLAAEMQKGLFFHFGSFKYDLRGFEKAFALMQKCMQGAAAEELPYEPLAESEPHEITKGWQMISLKLGQYRYARYAMLDGTGLGVWVHNVDDFVLSLSGLQQPNGPAKLTLNGAEYVAVPQSDGVMLPLTPELLRALEASPAAKIRWGSVEKTFDLKDFRAVVVALQPYE